MLNQGFVYSVWVGLGPVGVMDAFIRLGEDAAHQILIYAFGDEGDHRGQGAAHFDQGVPEGGIGGVFIAIVFRFPEAATRAAHVPVAQVVQQALEGLRGAVGVGIFKVLGDLGDHLVESGQDPSIQRAGALGCAALRGSRGETLRRRAPAIQRGVSCQEGVDIPQGDDEAAAGFFCPVEAEDQIVFGFVGAVEPAHGVHAHFVGGLVEFDGIAPGFVHLAAILG